MKIVKTYLFDGAGARAVLALPLLLILASATTAHSQNLAGWTKRNVGGGALFTTLSSPDGDHLFIGGTRGSLEGFTPKSQPHLYLSTNSGQNFQPLTLPELPAGGPFSIQELNSVFFIDSQTGWVAVGPHLLRSSDQGKNWESQSLGTDILSIYFSTSEQGVAAGKDGKIFRSTDGGQNWEAVNSPTSTDLFKQVWTSPNRGWLAGHRTCEFGGSHDPSVEKETKACDPVLLSTSNGGQSWTEHPLPSQVEGIDSLFFLRDGKTGFLAGHHGEGPDSRRAVLMKTEDGGQSFSEFSIPLELGTLNIGFGSPKPLYLTHIQAMYWETPQKGHLAGKAFLNESSSSDSQGGGGGKKIEWLLADYQTRDGGESWDYNSRGELTGTIFAPPAGNGYVGQGLLHDLTTGWMPGDPGSVWTYLKTCESDGDCDDSYVCSESKRCQRGEFEDDTPSDPGNPDGRPGSGFWGDDPPGDTEEELLEPGGCDCSSAPLAASGWLMLLLALARRRA